MTYPIDTDVPLPSKLPREISTIAFPYLDLGDGIQVARAMHGAGGVPLERDQLAAALGQMPNSGSFNTKISTARTFGLLDNATGKYQLTELGFEILDPERERGAKAAAFLNVPLYRRTFEEFKGRQLPPRPLGLEQAFVNFGVSPKQKDKARQAFERSARIAGFFPTPAEDRLVQPVLGLPNVQPQPNVPPPSSSGGIERVDEPETDWSAHERSSLHPSIKGMVDDLPEPKAEWSRAEQSDWLQAVAQILRHVYKAEADEVIEVTIRRRGV